ncbi:unnamed protein product [Rotaria sp. Silwood2]|nr:unnamed protein product [Rotaria sp. Silwood2]
MLLDTLPGDHSDIADVYNQIGAVHYINANVKTYMRDSELSHALEMFEKALAIRQQIYDNHDIRIAPSLNNIGSVYNDRGEYDRALDYYQRGLEILENAKVEANISKANLLTNFGILKERMNDYEAALSFYIKADDMLSQLLHVQHLTDNQKDLIKKSLYGHVCKLARHSIGCRVLEYCYNDICNSAERFQLVQEFYGREYAVLKTTDVKNIEELLANKTATGQRTNVLDYMQENLMACIQKDLLSASIIHRVMHEYLRNANEKGRTELIDAVKEKLIKMIHSRDGARVAIYCLWYGTNKDRKLLIKSLKSFVAKIAKEEQGYPVLWTIFDVIDDTKLVSKIILQELMSNFDEIINDSHGKKVLMYLIAPRNTKHLQYELIQLMKTSDSLNTSKKDPDVRQRELFEYCKSYFLEYFTANSLTTLKDGFRGFMMTEMIERLSPDDDLSSFYTSISTVLSTSSVEAQSETNFIEHQTAHNVLRHLIIADGKRQKKNKHDQTLVSTLLSSISPDKLRTWILCNRGCFIFVMMLEHGQPDECEQIRSLLVPSAIDTLKRQAFAGAKILVEKLLSSS